MLGTSSLLDMFLVDLTKAGVPIMVLAVALQWWRKDDRPGVRHTLISSGMAFLLGLAINQAILIFIHRIRPYDAGLTHLLIAPNPDFSFPSDHATASMAIAVTFLLRGSRRWGGAFLMVACIICFSRVYVGTHYLTDVLGGAVTASLAAFLVTGLYRKGTRLDRRLTEIF
ncbi:phosphatase PAP2 family protein [Hoeflea alexandrii]|uniref:phosphatase PAP2 family protein n=1 Tax=Hoeflea alexandrii TaxID=288436 RepID=UPI002D1E3DF6|nr:phosphatase PAP2 family protein [Hoeflea alexandrii]